MPSRTDVAVIVTVHHEGRELFPTFHALERTIADATALTTEVVIVCDRIDDPTRTAIEAVIDRNVLAHAASVSVIEVDNGDLSASRNDGIAASTAPIVGVLDADNLPSPNWLTKAFAVLGAQPEPAIVHPELIVSFGAKREVWPLVASTDPAFQPGWLAWFNTWDAFALADREVFERFPYPPSPPWGGFGPEDWAWNCQTVAAGIPHLLAEGTTLFYHATEHGLAAAHWSSLLPQNELLRSKEVALAALPRIADPPVWGEPEPKTATATIIRAARRALRPVARPIKRMLENRAQPTADEPREPQPAQSLPIDALMGHLADRRHEWAEAHLLQPIVHYPSDESLRTQTVWGDFADLFIPEQLAYWSAIRDLPEQIDVLFVVPWLRTGGSDLVTTQFIEAVRRTRPNANIALITTEPEHSTRLDALDGVTVFDLGQFALEPQWGQRILGTIIAQLRPGTVHVVNSSLGVAVIDRFGHTLRGHTRFFISTFVRDVMPSGATWSFLQFRSRDFYTKVDTVLTDNQALVRHEVEVEGAPEDAFLVHHGVVAETFLNRPVRSFTAEHPLRVVWAARFDLQKRLDRLADIAERMREQPIEFHVYGEEVIHDDARVAESLERLRALGVGVHPPYERGFAQVAQSADALLLTSDREGVPNTLLESMASGLSVIAPAVGDIARVLTDETGYLIADRTSIDEYVVALQSILDDPSEAHRRIANAHELMIGEYSTERFDTMLETLRGYLPRPDGGPSSGYRWFTDEATAALLASDAPLTLVYTGSNGHSNFGDILQNKNILRYWNDRPDRTPVLFLPTHAASSPERIDSLRTWFDCPNIVFFSDQRTRAPWGTTEIHTQHIAAPLHVVGGGYLNAFWGGQHFAAIGAIAADFDASEVFFTGLQVDTAGVTGFDALAERHVVPFVGLRDAGSLAIVHEHSGVPAIDTFDDLTEVLLDWARTAQAQPGTGMRVAVHMNTSDYAGGERALQVWRETLAQVAALEPEAVYLLSAYADERPEVRDTLGTVAALGEDFPFPASTLLDTARAALEWVPGEGLPKSLAELPSATLGLSSSYHTALMMSMLGVPTYLVGANSYFSQKAQLFALPSIAEFLANPERYRVDLTKQLTRRREWLNELDGRFSV